jgi:prepilin-type processing-associated H-X9-DG protein
MGDVFNGFGSTPGSDSATPLAVLACPSDQLPSPPTCLQATGYYVGLTSYLGNYGSISYLTQGVDGIFPDQGAGIPPVSLLGITDGPSNTILFGERYNYDPNWTTWSNVFINGFWNPFYAVVSPWGSDAVVGGPYGMGSSPLNYMLILANPPQNTDFSAIVTRVYAYGSGHPGGANFVFCDGSVHFLSNAINNAALVSSDNGPVTLLQALSTRAGGEVVDGSQY